MHARDGPAAKQIGQNPQCGTTPSRAIFRSGTLLSGVLSMQELTTSRARHTERVSKHSSVQLYSRASFKWLPKDWQALFDRE